MDTTMQRTKKYLVYFGRSFCKDKVAISFMLLILLTICGIIFVATLPAKGSAKSKSLSS